MPKWEYLVISWVRSDNGAWSWSDNSDFVKQNRLNALGEEGWELVEVVPVDTYGPGGTAVLTTVQLHYFKRLIAT